MRWWRWLRVGVAALAVVALLAALVSWLLAPEDRYPGFAFEEVPGITDSLRTAAMVSVHVHARIEDEDTLALVMPLDAAIGILSRDTAPAGTSRKRRAIATLASSGLEVVDDAWKLRRFQDELRDLGADPDFINDQAGDLPLVLLPAQLFTAAADWYVELTADCPWENLTGGIGPWDPNNPPIEWSYSVEVPRRVHDIARALDPQMWDVSSTYFPDTYLADVDPPCCPPSANSTCAFPPGPTPPGAGDVAAGKPYGPSPLYENYCFDKGGGCGACPTGGCQIDIRNIMCVTTEYDIDPWWSWLAPCADRYEVHYGLGNWIQSTVLGVTQNHKDSGPLIYAVTLDTGKIAVERSLDKEAATGAAWSDVELTKELRFNSVIVDMPARGLLRNYAREIGEQLADQACFDVPVESWAPSWWNWFS